MRVHHLNGTVLLLAIIGHLVGDYLVQNDWMALNKKQRSWPCVVHCALWTLAVCVFAAPAFTYRPGLWWVPVALFLTHFAQDRTGVIAWYMDLNGQTQFRTGPCAPWSIIVVDNVWHLVAMSTIWRFL